MDTFSGIEAKEKVMTSFDVQTLLANVPTNEGMKIIAKCTDENNIQLTTPVNESKKTNKSSFDLASTIPMRETPPKMQISL